VAPSSRCQCRVPLLAARSSERPSLTQRPRHRPAARSSELAAQGRFRVLGADSPARGTKRQSPLACLLVGVGGVFFFFFLSYPNRLTKWRDYGVLFRYPNQAAICHERPAAPSCKKSPVRPAARHSSCGGIVIGPATAEMLWGPPSGASRCVAQGARRSLATHRSVRE
jgi:hypothetical protein